MKEITHDYLKEMFTYDGHDLVWKTTRGMATAGRVAGTVNSRGYRHIRLFGKFYQAHRLVWLYVTGEILPDGVLLDHINGDRLDNRIDNLRKCNFSENACNTKAPSTSRTGIKNVIRVGDAGFRVECKLNGKAYISQIYRSVEEAANIRDAFVKNIHTTFAR